MSLVSSNLRSYSSLRSNLWFPWRSTRFFRNIGYYRMPVETQRTTCHDPSRLIPSQDEAAVAIAHSLDPPWYLPYHIKLYQMYQSVSNNTYQISSDLIKSNQLLQLVIGFCKSLWNLRDADSFWFAFHRQSRHIGASQQNNHGRYIYGEK